MIAVQFSIMLMVGVLIGCTERNQEMSDSAKISPILVSAVEKKGFATFTHKDHPGNRIGYRFFEHTPLIYGDIPLDLSEDVGINRDNVRKKIDYFANRPNVYIYNRHINQDDHWVKQEWTYYLLPVDDGIEILLTIQTFNEGLPAYYGVQQCFRLSGQTNEEWRQKIALTPAFSEYDLWAKEEHIENKTSLTYVWRNDHAQALPALPLSVGCRTPLGIKIDKLRWQGRLPEEVGAYKAKMDAPADNGLIFRVDNTKTWISGIFWERTTHVTNHHPADCLHSIVNIGNTPANTMRALRGKIYWFQGQFADLKAKFERDFQ